MTRHANQNAPFSALLSPSEGGRGVTVQSGDTISVARGERHIRLNNGITTPVGPAILNSPNTFIGHDFGQILTLEKGSAHEDTAAATIVHGTSGVYFKDGQDLSLSDTCRWVTIVFTGNGWMEVARDGDSSTESLLSLFATDHVASGSEAGHHSVIHQDTVLPDETTQCTITLLSETTDSSETPVGKIRTYIIGYYASDDGDSENGVGEYSIPTQTIAVTSNTKLVLIGGTTLANLYLHYDTPFVPAHLALFGPQGVLLGSLGWSGGDDLDENETTPTYPEDPIPLVLSFNRMRFNLMIGANDLLGGLSVANKSLRFTTEDVTDMEDEQTMLRLCRMEPGDDSSRLEIGSYARPVSDIVTKKISIGLNGQTLTSGIDAPTAYEQAGSVYWRTSGQAYVSHGNGTWNETGADPDALASIISLFGIDHNATTGIHTTIQQEVPATDTETPLAAQLMYETTGGTSGGKIRVYHISQYAPALESDSPPVQNTWMMMTYNAALQLLGDPLDVYFQMDTVFAQAYAYVYGMIGFQVLRFLGFDDEPTAPESWPTSAGDPTPAVFGMGRWTSVIGLHTGTEHPTLTLVDGALEIQSMNETDPVNPEGRIRACTIGPNGSSDAVDLGTSEKPIRDIHAQDVHATTIATSVVNAETAVIGQIEMGADEVTIGMTDGEPTEEASTGSLRLGNDGYLYVRRLRGWYRVVTEEI